MNLRTKIIIRYLMLSIGTFAITWIVTGSSFLGFLASVMTIMIMTGAKDV